MTSGTTGMTPLSVAFVWHMHQPEYKDALTGRFLMPWVRLHAIKDYLDMVTILERYPKVRQTFNLVPSLIDQIEDYAQPGVHDQQMAVTVAETLTVEDKRYIFERCFDAAPFTMIARSPYYNSLYERRNRIFRDGDIDLTAFTDQEYHDITALFNLVWFDPIWIERDPALAALWNKGRDYSLADRQQILEIQRELIARILPAYRAYQEAGQIEVITTPYYHPILPLLIDSDSAKVAMPDVTLPENRFQHAEDAKWQVEQAWEKYKGLFGRNPVGVWPAEQSISPAALEMLGETGFKWAISSEGNLSRSLNRPIDKDPYGNILNPEVYCRPYRYAGVNLLFRNLTLSDLIGFHYATMPAEHAANDLMMRIKFIQQRCHEANVPNPILTIALDGENCWESFPNDGHDFLNALYTKLSQDETLNVCRVCDYFDTIPETDILPLEQLHSGSWINSNFHIWIGDPVKNAAWRYLKQTRDDLERLSVTGDYHSQALQHAWREIYIAEGSDWFWWYGEPHNSGQDEVFDMQFRRHLANVYRYLHLPIPDYLDMPLTAEMKRPVITPAGPINPPMTGKLKDNGAWELAGRLDMSHGAMHRATQILQSVYFGGDGDRFFIRFDLNQETLTPHHELFLYFCTPGKTRHNSPVRVKSATGGTVGTQRYLYAYELQLSRLQPNTDLQITGAEALPDFLWYQRNDLVDKTAFEDVLELSIPFDAMGVYPGDYLQFAVAVVVGGTVDVFQPADFLLSIKRQDRNVRFVPGSVHHEEVPPPPETVLK